MPRAYGITNAAPYASAPAVGVNGDTYWNTTEKVLYVSDGTAWVRMPSGSASGSLAGAYPAPTIAPLAVGTAALADSAVTAAKLASPLAVFGIGFAQLSSDFTLSATVGTVFTTTVGSGFRGGAVLSLADFWGLLNMANTTTTRISVVLKFDGTAQRVTVLESTATANMVGGWIPFGGQISSCSYPAAGAHTVTVEAQITAGSGTWIFKSGALTTLAFA